MTEQSPTEFERDAERIRAEIADTAEHLKDKMSPGQLMDEVVNYFKDGDTNQLLHNLKTQVRDNPLALGLVGSGLAWLMMGSGPSAKSRRPSHSVARTDFAARPERAMHSHAGASPGVATSGKSSSQTSSVGERAAHMRDAVGGGVQKTTAALGSAAHSVSSTLHDARDAASESFAHTADASAELGHRAKSTFLDAMEREPLVMGALGVAVGAAIGAMLPSTRTEKEYLGAASASARDSAETALSEGFDKAKHVASDVYTAARDEADRQGFATRGETTAEKVTKVAKAAGEELKSAAGQSVHDAEKSADKTTDNLSPHTRPKI